MNNIIIMLDTWVIVLIVLVLAVFALSQSEVEGYHPYRSWWWRGGYWPRRRQWRRWGRPWWRRRYLPYYWY